MALNTRNRRASALLDAVTWPHPDNSLAFAGDRQHMAEVFSFTTVAAGGGSSGTAVALPNSTQSRWVIPFQTGPLTIQVSGSNFIITSR